MNGADPNRYRGQGADPQDVDSLRHITRGQARREHANDLWREDQDTGMSFTDVAVAAEARFGTLSAAGWYKPCV